MPDGPLLALTGFMGVGKTSVARHLAHLLGTKKVDLDSEIESSHRRTIAEIIDSEGDMIFREVEAAVLRSVVGDSKPGVLSLGGGTWTVPENRGVIKAAGYRVIWLESSFEHCWINIKFSRKDRPLGRDKASTRQLFQERQSHYCLADWHFIVRPDHTSIEVARQIIEQLQ